MLTFATTIGLSMKWSRCIFLALSFYSILIAYPTTAHGTAHDVLKKIALRSRDSKSDAVLITRNGKVIFEYRTTQDWQALETMSMTKSFVNLAIGFLLQDRKIPSVDVPVHEFYPEWNQGQKKLITIRHLLNYTSGLQAEADAQQIERAPDIIQLALVAEVVTPPGTHFCVNNKALNLLSGIIKKASGMDVNEYLSEKLFAPIGISDVVWVTDSKGTPYAMSHMMMTAPDLAKVGWLLANRGFWCSRRIVRGSWIDFSTRPSQEINPFYGLLWFIDYYNIDCWWDQTLLQQYVAAGVDPVLVQRLSCLCGKVINCTGRCKNPMACKFWGKELARTLGGKQYCDYFFKQLQQCRLPLAKWKVGGMKSYSARGYQGQQLIIYPSYKLVGVRQVAVNSLNANCIDPFEDFGPLLEELAWELGL
jgi:hypothetical protein